MKTRRYNAIVAAAALAAVSASTALAGGGGGAQFTPITTREAAERVPARAPAMLACAGCKTVAVIKAGGILEWFTPDKKHVCPGCGSTVRFVGTPGKSGSTTTFSHTCSRCGNASAYICAEHKL